MIPVPAPVLNNTVITYIGRHLSIEVPVAGGEELGDHGAVPLLGRPVQQVLRTVQPQQKGSHQPATNDLLP